MFALGGATSGHVWSDYEFVESHPRLNINALHQAGALRDGAETSWVWKTGQKGSLRATHGEIFLSVEDREQVIRIDWLPFLKNRYVRPRFLCSCGLGAYCLHYKAGTFACRRCCGYDYKIRHRQLYQSGSLYRRLRQQLNADLRLGTPIPLPPRRRGPGKRRWIRLVRALAREEARAYSDVARLLRDLEQRTKSKAKP